MAIEPESSELEANFVVQTEQAIVETLQQQRDD
jgi:hypothetical protein